jgi:hypothetical protein
VSTSSRPFDKLSGCQRLPPPAAPTGSGRRSGWRHSDPGSSGNTVTSNDSGIEVAAENAGSADHVLVARNLITRSAFVGIATGGYCNGGEVCGGEQTGLSHDNRFAHDVLHANNQLDNGSPEVLVQQQAYRNTFEHDVVWATNHARAVIGMVAGAGSDQKSTPLRADHNTCWTTGGRP